MPPNIVMVQRMKYLMKEEYTEIVNEPKIDFSDSKNSLFIMFLHS